MATEILAPHLVSDSRENHGNATNQSGAGGGMERRNMRLGLNFLWILRKSFGEAKFDKSEVKKKRVSNSSNGPNT